MKVVQKQVTLILCSTKERKFKFGNNMRMSKNRHFWIDYDPQPRVLWNCECVYSKHVLCIYIQPQFPSLPTVSNTLFSLYGNDERLAFISSTPMKCTFLFSKILHWSHAFHALEHFQWIDDKNLKSTPTNLVACLYVFSLSVLGRFWPFSSSYAHASACGWNQRHSLTIKCEMKRDSDPQSTAVIQWTLLSSGLHCSVFVAPGFWVWP